MEPDQILEQDCLPVMAAMPDKSVASVICDPPYPNGQRLFSDQLIDGIAGLYLAAKKAEKHVVFFWSPVVDPPQPPPGYYETARHVWSKPDCRSTVTYEHIIVWSRDYHRQPFRVWTIPILDYRSLAHWKPHPTQKPLRLMRLLISMYTQPGDLVLDPFAGTGTTGVAAKQLGRQYILIESNKEYAEFTRDRLRTPTAELQGPPEQPTEQTPAVVEEEIALDELKEQTPPPKPVKAKR